MRRSFSAATLLRLREMPGETVLAAISMMVKEDTTFIPTKDPRTRRWNICTETGDYEILTTGCKWYDTRAKVGGGGAVDLAMHVLRLSFVDAVKQLIACLDSDGSPGP